MSDAAKKNPMIKWFIVHVLVIAALIAGFFILTKMPKGEVAPQDTVVYLVRHAEKVTGENAGRDPGLTAEGKTRADILAGLLASENITKIYSSDYIRTRDTAAPTSKMSGVNIEIYDPQDLPALAKLIKSAKGSYLVVGHSNTIPETVNALGGVGGTPIFEKSEYDRLYVVAILADGTVQTDLRRYGTRYVPETSSPEIKRMSPTDDGSKKN